MNTFVSVIIATRNRDALLAQTLHALAGQRWPSDRYEIIVADNGSTDGTRAVVDAAAAAGPPSIVYLYVSESGKSYAVNAALRRARGDILAFTDDDVLPEPAWIERLVNVFEETGADFAAGRILPRWERTPPSWLSPALYGVLAIPDNGETRQPIGPGGKELIPIGANMAVRRHVIDRLGGLRGDLGKLEGTLRTGEDHEFYLRMLHAGCRGVYEPTALVRHWVPETRLDRGYCRRWLYQNGRDVARLDHEYVPELRRFAHVPGYLWRQALNDVVTVVRTALSGDARTRVAAAMRVAWFGGYVRQAWLGAQVDTAMQLAEER